MFLLDTCVVSEGSKPSPSPVVDAWFSVQKEGDLFLSSVSAGEIRYGIDRLARGHKRNALEDWFEETVIVGFAGRIVAFDLAAAVCWGDLRARFPEAKFVDGQLAATALVHGLTLVTRNVADFHFPNLSLLNPWDA
jgi:predicted nucleic acid-binding protein